MTSHPKPQICRGSELSTSNGTIASISEIVPNTRFPAANHTATRRSAGVPRRRGPNTNNPMVPTANRARTTRCEGEYAVNTARPDPASAAPGPAERESTRLGGRPEGVPRAGRPADAHHVVLRHQDVSDHDHHQVELRGDPDRDGEPVEAGVASAARVEVGTEIPPDRG